MYEIFSAWLFLTLQGSQKDVRKKIKVGNSQLFQSFFLP